MSFPWIKVNNDLPDHHKSDAFASALNTPRAWTHVVELWLWASRMKPDGNLADVSDAIVARRAGWDGDAAAFVAALVKSGWLTPDRRLHDWEEHQGAIRDKAERDRERARERRATGRKTGPATPSLDDGPATGRATSPETGPATGPGTGPGREERRGEEKREERERESAPAPPPEPQKPEPLPQPAPAPRVVTAESNRRFRTRAEHEMPFWRDDPKTFLAEVRDPDDDSAEPRLFASRLRQRFPAYDGRSGRPTIEAKVTEKWGAFDKAFHAHGITALQALENWIGEAYPKAKNDWLRDGNLDVAAISPIAARGPVLGPAPEPDEWGPP